MQSDFNCSTWGSATLVSATSVTPGGGSGVVAIVTRSAQSNTEMASVATEAGGFPAFTHGDCQELLAKQRFFREGLWVSSPQRSVAPWSRSVGVTSALVFVGRTKGSPIPYYQLSMT